MSRKYEYWEPDVPLVLNITWSEEHTYCDVCQRETLRRIPRIETVDGNVRIVEGRCFDHDE